MKFTSLVLLAIALVAPPRAQAHVHLTASTPAAGSVVKSAPSAIVLTFSAATRLMEMRIRRSDQRVAQELGPLPKSPDVQFRLSAPKLSPGVYTLTFRAVSVQDRHMSSGTFSFTLNPGNAPDHARDRRNIGTKPAPAATP